MTDDHRNETPSGALFWVFVGMIGAGFSSIFVVAAILIFTRL